MIAPPGLLRDDDADDDTTAQLTHAPRGRDAFAGQMRTAMHALVAVSENIVRACNCQGVT